MKRFVTLGLGLVASATLGCAAYQGGAFADRNGAFPGPTTTVGCIDLAVSRVADPHKSGSVLQYSFGNRCTHAATLDLQSVRVFARDDRGWQRTLVAFDPRNEIRPLVIAASWTGREQIEYRDPYQQFFDSNTIAICVDLAAIDGTPEPVTRQLCMGAEVQP